MTVNESLACVVREMRKARKISKIEFGRRIGLSHEQMHQLELRACGAKLDRVFRIAEELGYPVEDFIKLVNLRRFERETD